MIFSDLENLPTIHPTPQREKPKSTQFRSNLMVRADNPKHLNKLNELTCDVATINLEDGIADKAKALELTKIFCSHLQNSHSKIAIRVNEIDNGGLDEIEELAFLKPDAFRIPKIRAACELKEILKVVPKESDIYLTIETKEAFNAIHSFANPKVKMLYFGVLDLLADLKLPQSLVDIENETMNFMLAKFVLDARFIDTLPISFTFQQYKDTKTYEAWCEKSKRMGFVGQSCIAPNQVEIANSTFGFEASEIERAKYIKNIFEENQKNGITGFSDEKYGFIDEPIYRDALTILGK